MKYLVLHIDNSEFNPLFKIFFYNWSKNKKITNCNISNLYNLVIKKKVANNETLIEETNQLKRKIKNHEVIVPLFFFTTQNYPLFKILFESKKKIESFWIGLSANNRIPNIIYLLLKNILIKLFIYIKFKRRYIYDQIIYCGNIPLRYNLFLYNKKIRSNPNPYYELLRNDRNLYIKKDYCVFVDVNIEDHKDAAISERSIIDIDNYYNSLKDLFKIIEKKLNLKIIIALHPSRKNTKLFNSYQCYDNCTVNLIQNSKLVLTHHSTANFFIFYFNKPFILLSNNEILKNKNHSIGYSLINLSKYTKSKLLNLDNFDENNLNNYLSNFKKHKFIKDFIDDKKQ